MTRPYSAENDEYSFAHGNPKSEYPKKDLQSAPVILESMAEAPKKFMVAVDDSDGALRAADFAIALAAKLGSEVLFMNVVGASSSESAYQISADMVGSFEKMGLETLSKCEQDAKARGVQATTLLVFGTPSIEILLNAQKMKCDCIVMGKRGMSELEKRLMGSVSDAVTKQSEVPVILVK
jgi:nucleotide-binding universal stress UspA family protein